MVYHYTTIETLYNILASYKEAEDKEYFTFWASNALEQNDTEELSFSFKDLYEVLLQVEKNKKENGEDLSHKKLSEAIEWGKFENKNPNEIKDEIDKLVKDREQTPYTLSFSRQKDKLLMWSIYANGGNGICLAFNENKLTKIQAKMTCCIDNVKYNIKKNDLTNLVNQVYDAYLKSFEGDDIISLNKVFDEGTTYLRMMLGLISPFIKNKAFGDEKEWRIAFYKNKETNIFTRLTGNQNIVHYVKVGLPISALSKIIVGPCANYNNVVDLLQNEASSCGIAKMAKPEFYLKSNVPFRNF